MFCKNCGKQLTDGAQFCQYCGQKVTVIDFSASERNTVQQSAVQRETAAQEATAHTLTEPEEYVAKSGSSKGLAVGIAIGIAAALTGVLVYVFVIGSNKEPDDAGDMPASGSRHEETMGNPHEGNLAEDEPTASVPSETPEPQAPAPASDAGEEPWNEPDSQYILPTSNTQYLTIADLEGLTKEDCRIARNELYARHGRRFDDAGLQGYFDSCGWYEGTIAPSDFDDSVLNEYETANRDLIVQYEKDMGYR